MIFGSDTCRDVMAGPPLAGGLSRWMWLVPGAQSCLGSFSASSGPFRMFLPTNPFKNHVGSQWAWLGMVWGGFGVGNMLEIFVFF